MAKVSVNIRLEREMIKRATEKSREDGFDGFTAYVRYLIQEDLAGGSLEHFEQAFVGTVSQLDRKMTGMHTVQQRLFALNWAMAEILLRMPCQDRDETSEMKVRDFRLQLARELKESEDVNGNKQA